MKSKILVTILLVLQTISSFGQKKDSQSLIDRPADIGIIYPLTTNGINAAGYNNKLSLQAIAGVSGGITGGAFAGIANIVKEDVHGCLFAGILNLTGNNASGGQFAGLANIVKNKTEGFQAAGLLNRSGKINGVQVSGLGNIVSKGGRTVQISGLFNRAADTHSQMAGLINIAKKITGVQISGLINIADSSDHPIGFINIIKNGEKNIGVSLDENRNVMISFYSGGKSLYGLIGLGYNPGREFNYYALQAGIGAHLFNAGSHFRTNLEIAQLAQTDFKHGHCFTYSVRVFPEIKIYRKLVFFAGPTANLQLDYSNKKISSLTGHHFWATTGTNGHFIGSYIGVTGGIKFIL